jgi:hypothetical protein
MERTMTPLVRSQILDIRNTGLTIMFDTTAVEQLADDFVYYDFATWFPEHRKEYAAFILFGD